MANLLLPDFAGEAQRGYQFGTQNRLARVAEQKQNQLSQLASQAYAASPDQRQGIIGQAVGVDPSAGLALGQHFDQMQERQQKQQWDTEDRAVKQDEQRNKTLFNMSRMLVSAPEQMRPGLYARMVPSLQQMGMTDLPLQYDAQSSQTIMGTAQSLLRAFGAQSNGAKVISPGGALVGDDGRVIYERPAAPTVEWELVDVPRTNPDGTPGGTVQMERNRHTGAFRRPNYGGGAAASGSGQSGGAAMGSNHLENFQTLADMFPGTRITSLNRSAQRNAEVGGVPNSQHLSGTAGDFVPPAEHKQAFIQRARAMGYEAIDEGNHVHLELPPGARTAGPGGLGYTAPKSEGGKSRVLFPEEVAEYGLPAGTVAQMDGKGDIKILHKPEKGEEFGSSWNPRQKTAVQGVQRNLIQYAATLTGTAPALLQDMNTAEIAELVRTKGKRDMQGAQARLAERYTPFGIGRAAAEVANQDIISYTNGAGAAWAAFENPTGMITNADRESATLQMPTYLDPPEVQAAKIQGFLELSGWDNRAGAGSVAPPAGRPSGSQTQAYTVGQEITAPDGRRYRVIGGDPSDPEVEAIQ